MTVYRTDLEAGSYLMEQTLQLMLSISTVAGQDIQSDYGPEAEAKYGHRGLVVSDFGWWHCRACDKSGDDWTSPKDFACEAAS